VLSKSGSGLGGDEKPAFGSRNTPRVAEGFTEGSFGWQNLCRAITDGLADTWFEALDPKPYPQNLPKGWDTGASVALGMFAGFFGSGDEALKTLPSLVIDFDSLGESVPLEESPLGKALIKTLQANDVNWMYRRLYVNDKCVVEERDQKLEGQATWLNDFEMPVVHYFRVMRDKDGKERVLWSAPLMAATRRFEHIAKRDAGEDVLEISSEDVAKGALTFGQWSTQIFIPLMLKKLFYLAETPFPSNIMSFPRKMAFGELDPARYPVPVAFFETDGEAGSAVEQIDGNYKYMRTLLPSVLHAGWTFDTTDTDEIFTILQKITDGINRMSTIVEDGYLNFRNDDFAAPWDDVVLSAAMFRSDFRSGDSAKGMSVWIPNTRLGFVINESIVQIQRTTFTDDSLRRPASEWTTYNGAGGPMVASGTNSFAFSYLIPEGELDEAERVLRIAIELDAGYESTNAMSNLGVIYFKRDNLDEAEKWFKLALEQKDKFAQDEQCYFLHQIALKRGDKAQAAEFETRCANLGGYEGDYGTIAPSDDYEPFPVTITGQVKERTFGGFMDYINAVEEVITPDFNGFFNIESGYLGISTRAHPFCSDCQGLSDEGISYSCGKCGRDPSNYLVVRASNGDAMYVNFDLMWDGNRAGALTILDESGAFALELFSVFDEMAKGNALVGKPIEMVWEFLNGVERSMTLEYLGTLATELDERFNKSNPVASMFFGDAGEGRDSLSATVYNRGFKIADHSVYAFCERDASNNGILVPRLILTVRTNVAQQLGLPQEPTVDWVEEGKLWSGSTSNNNPAGLALAASVANFQAMRGYRRWQAEGITDIELSLQLASWRLHLVAIGGDSDGELTFEDNATTLEFVKIAYRLRNLYTLSDEYTGGKPFAGDSGANLTFQDKDKPPTLGGGQTESGLTKTGGGLGLASSNAGNAGGESKPCSRCSMPIKAGEGFCNMCGAPAR